MKTSELVDELSDRFEELTKVQRAKFIGQLGKRHSELSNARTKAYHEARRATTIKALGWMKDESRFKLPNLNIGLTKFNYRDKMFYFDSFPKSITINMEQISWEDRIIKNVKIPKTGGAAVFNYLVTEACDSIMEEYTTRQVVDA